MSEIHKINITDLDSLIHQIGYDKESLLNTVILNQVVQNWKEIIGPVYVNQAQPIRVDREILFLRVSHSAYKMEIGFIKDSILRSANKIFQRPLLKKIEIQVGNLQYKPSPREVLNETLEGKSELVEVIQREEDEFIRNKLLNFVKKLKR
ncbi:MAG: DUF721 domain-containing protein [Leptospiraceae bacterium]|nr:DUF721 domain-containing protein [Leptospiraceae bacterium]